MGTWEGNVNDRGGRAGLGSGALQGWGLNFIPGELSKQSCHPVL